MTISVACAYCQSPLESDHRFCSKCGQTTGQILWSSSLNRGPAVGRIDLRPEGALYLVANNVGSDAVRIRIDTSRLRGLLLVNSSEARAEPHQAVAFELRHQANESVGGTVDLFSEDGQRPRPSIQEPQARWWQPRAERHTPLRAQDFVRLVEDLWIIGSPCLLFPPGVRRQFVRVWNDADRARSFSSQVPAGYRITNITVPLEKKAPELFAQDAAGLTLMVESLPDRGPGGADAEWLAGPDAEVVSIRRLSAVSADLGADVVIAIDFGTRNTGVRVRWRHELVVGKPRGTVDVIGDRDGNARFPTEMALHRAGRTFRWGSEVPRGDLNADEVRISNLKTLLRVNSEPYLRDNPHWTNAYLLERYFEQLFTRIDAYFRTVDPALSRDGINIRYVLSRPVLDANEGDEQGRRYQQALRIALHGCGVGEDRITFVQEPAAAAYGIAKRRAAELLALKESTPIAVVDAGGGTTDIALARVSLRDGRVALDIRATHALHLDPENPALPAVQHFGAKDRIEFGGDVLDYALTYRLLTDASGLLETEGRPVPARVEVAATPLPLEEQRRSEAELVRSCRRMKEAFAYVSTQHLARAADQPAREHEHYIFANRPEYEGIYLEQSLFGSHLIAPILRTPLQEMRGAMEEKGFEEQGIRPSQIRHVFYVGGTNIEFYLRQQFQEVFPNSPQLMAEGHEGIEGRIAERLNAVVEGAVWCDEALFAASPLALSVTVPGIDRSVIGLGDPLPPESTPIFSPLPVRLEPLQELEAELRAACDEFSEVLTIARGFYRNTSDTGQDGTLQVRISREKGVIATLVVNGRNYEQWRIALTESVP